MSRASLSEVLRYHRILTKRQAFVRQLTLSIFVGIIVAALYIPFHAAALVVTSIFLFAAFYLVVTDFLTTEKKLDATNPDSSSDNNAADNNASAGSTTIKPQPPLIAAPQAKTEIEEGADEQKEEKADTAANEEVHDGKTI